MTERKAIEAHDLGIKYDLRLTRHRSVRSSLASVQRWRPSRPKEVFWALHGVDFEIGAGECLGVIGRNGSGKSTLLLAMAGVILPDAGMIDTFGARATLLTLGAGFELELTGYQNIFLNAAYLGISQKETERLLEPIIDFSELGPFIDAPLKTYSTGMRSRLGFAIAAHTAPDILLLDEVMSVGDAGFQEKSRARLEVLMEQARAIVIVSHSVEFLAKTCSSILWLDEGTVRDFGKPEKLLAEYKAAIEGPAAIPGQAAAEAAPAAKPPLRAVGS